MSDFVDDSTYELVSRLAKREDIEPSKVIELISKSFSDAYENEKEGKKKVEIFFDSEERGFKSYRIYTINDNVSNPQLEISSNDQRLQRDEIKITNGKALFPIDLKELPKFVAHRIRKNIERLIQEIRKEKQYKIFSPLKGEIVTGSIQSIQGSFCIINLGKGLGY